MSYGSAGLASGKEQAIINDKPDPTKSLIDRMERWSQAIVVLQDYVESHITIQKGISTGLEKSRKILGDAPHFDSSSQRIPSGEEFTNPNAPKPTVSVTEAFEALQVKNDGLITKSKEVEASLKKSILPQLNTVKADIDKHVKTIKNLGTKNIKEVEKAKTATQHAIETLGTHVSSFSIADARRDYKTDPYVLHRLTMNALEDQVTKENNQLESVISFERNLQELESYIIDVMQQTISLLDSFIGDYSISTSDTYGFLKETFNSIVPVQEWENFVSGPNSLVIPYDTPKRSLENIEFSNMDAPPTKPVIQGFLERKEGKVLKSYSSAYYVVTPGKFFLQYASQDFVKDSAPELAFYIPDCQIDPLPPRSGGKCKFQMQAKDVSRTIGLGSHNYSFKTNTYDELVAWYNALTQGNPNGEISPQVTAQS